MHVARAATVQGLIEERHRAPIGGAAFGNVIADGHGRKRAELFFYFAAALFFLFRLARIGEWGGRAARNVAEIFLRQCHALVRFHVAEYEENSIVWHVVGLEERLNVSQISGVEIGEIAVEIVGVGPVAKGHRRQIEPREPAIGLVHHVDAHFFFNDIALVAQVFVVYLERTHAVCFQPQNAVECVGGHGLVVVRYIVVRRAIQQAAAGVDQFDVLHLGSIRGTLKHHVLEQVREAAAALRLETKTDLVIDADGYHRRGGVRHDDHFQPVRQS